MILEYANNDAELCKKIPTRLALLDWGNYVGARAYYGTHNYINDIIECEGLVMRFTDEDLEEFLTNNNYDDSKHNLTLSSSERNTAVQKIKRIQRDKAPTASSQFFDSVPPKNANETADESERLHSSSQIKLSQ